MCHRNGVTVLGTFIVEWEEGEALLQRILSDRDLLLRVAHQLVAIARHRGFEGWLLNVECPVKAELVPELKLFCSLVSAECRVVW